MYPIGRELTLAHLGCMMAMGRVFLSPRLLFGIEWVTHEDRRTFKLRWPEGTTARDLQAHEERVQAFEAALTERYQVSSKKSTARAKGEGTINPVTANPCPREARQCN